MTQSTFEPNEGSGLRSTTPAAGPLQQPVASREREAGSPGDIPGDLRRDQHDALGADHPLLLSVSLPHETR
jgi:hypothetical protein